MKEPRVSVVVRTFNRPLMLRRALQSIAAQTWPEVEAVVVNDGGEDVAALIEELRPTFRRPTDLTYLSFTPEAKPGRCLAATRAIEASTGAFICYLDDDDFYLPHHVETLMTAQKESGAQTLYTDANHATEEPIGPNGEYVITRVRPGPSEKFSRGGFYAGTYIHLVTFCHSRSVFDRLGGFDPELPVLEDLDLFFRYAQDHDFEHVPVVTAQFQIRSDQTNAVSSMRREFIETRQKLMRKYMHVAVADIATLIEDGRDRLVIVTEDLEKTQARVAKLEKELEKVLKELQRLEEPKR